MELGSDACATAERPLAAARDSFMAGRLPEVFADAVAAVALVRGDDLTVAYANPAFTAMCRGVAEVGDGTPVGRLGLPSLARAVAEVVDSGLAQRAEEQRTASAEEQLATLTVSPVARDGDPGVDVLVIGLDVTGQAQDRREVQRSADENRWLGDATAAMQVESDPAEELVALARALVPAFADACSAVLLDRPTTARRHLAGSVLRGRRVAFAAADDTVTPLELRGGLEWGPDAGALHDAVRADRAVVQTVAAAGWSVEAGVPPAWVRGGRVTSVAAAPIRDGSATVGLLTFATVDRPPFSRADLAVMERVAVRAGTAIGLGLRFARQRDASLTLQRSMLTQAPTVPGLEVATRYRPSVADAEVGGDWYDAFARPDGDLMVAIGDVAGHDLTAAATMGQLRSMLRVLAVDRDAPPAELLSRLDVVATGLDVTDFTTLVLGRLRVRPGGRGPVSLQWSSAGHPPPLLLPAAGGARLLEEGLGMVLGVRPDSPRTTAAVTLEADDTLLLYTDGLVERRGRNPDANVATLVAQASAAGRGRGERDRGPVPLGELCDELVARAPVDDDVAVLAVRFRPDARPTS